MKQLTFIRHAESAANAGGLTMPNEAIPLSDLGLQQALGLAAAFSVSPSTVIVSGMVRTQQTADPLCKRYRMTPSVNVALNEFSAIDPALIKGLNGLQRKPLVEAYWNESDPEKRVGENADTFNEFRSRVTNFLSRLDELPDGASIFGHGIWFCLLLWLMRGQSAEGATGMQAFRHFQLDLPMPNCAVYKLQDKNGRWDAQEDVEFARYMKQPSFERNVRSTV